MIFRGKGTRISRIEKYSYNPLINVRWQNKAWVDREVMLEISRTFAEFKRENHGDDAVLLFADNLDAHCHLPVLEIFAQANIFVWFVVPVALILFSQ